MGISATPENNKPELKLLIEQSQELRKKLKEFRDEDRANHQKNIDGLEGIKDLVY